MKNLIRVGLIGCGNISPAYLEGCKPYKFMKITACADLDTERAKARAKEFGVDRVLSVDQLIADPEIDIVLNLTVPAAHAKISLAALRAGKHAYSEKPFAVLRRDGQKVLAEAKRRKLKVGCAPDTFLGGGIQTARHAIDSGAIGEPVAATAFFAGHGMEDWHPNPEFFYQKGGGPMFDLGPYYVTTLVNLLGPIKRVTGSTRITFPKRTITAKGREGQSFKVTTPTHITGTAEFANGAIATIITSFDIWAHHLPRIEIHGTTGSLNVPDPNNFDGPVELFRAGQPGWKKIAHTHSTKVRRGIGLADMARAILTRRPYRASGELAMHVLDVMSAFEESSTSGKHIKLKTTCARPAALPTGLRFGDLD